MGADDRSRSPVNARLGDGIQPSKRLPRQPNLLLLKWLQLSPLRIVSLHVHLQEICMDVLILVDLAHKPRCRIVLWIWQRTMLGKLRSTIADACDVTAVHLAPPCGTCSKAGGYAGIPMTNGV